MQYHYYLQGFIYSLLKDSRFQYLHDKKGYKLFCFSNIFPAAVNLEKNDFRTLIISSPNEEFITYLFDLLQNRSNNREAEIKIGKMQFRIDSFDKFCVELPCYSPFTLVTGTPIIVRIPKEKFNAYSSESINKYEYVY